jgi:hypothetical protein
MNCFLAVGKTKVNIFLIKKNYKKTGSGKQAFAFASGSLNQLWKFKYRLFYEGCQVKSEDIL